MDAALPQIEASEPEENHVLVVDDDRLILSLLDDVLSRDGFQVTTASSCLAAMRLLEDQTLRFNFLITDWELPDGNGVELIQHIRNSHTGNYIYAVVMTSHDRRCYNTQALEAGGDDFVSKPIDRGELMARLRAGERILKLESRLTNLANFDIVTQLPTRRMFEALAAKEWSRSKRYRLPLSCVVFDLDFFKRVNDTYGHRIGDQVLRKIAKLFRDSSRKSDIICRYGGEEFCILLPETTLEQSTRWAERLLSKIAAEIFELESVVLQVTASFGVAEILADMDDLGELVDLADQCLLQAKESGRNRVVSCQDLQTAHCPGKTGGLSDIFEGATARDGMTAVISHLKPESNVVDVSRFFLQFRISSAPVVDAQGQLVGIVSERDLMSAAKLQNPHLIQISEIMRKNVITYEADTPLRVVWDFLTRVSIRGVLVVDRGSPIGYIGRQTLLRWLANSVWARREDHLEIASSRTNRIESIAQVAQMLEEEAAHIAGAIRPLDPFAQQALVVGTVSRMQELINDLLASSGELGTNPGPGRVGPRTGSGETVQGFFGTILTTGPH